MIQANELRIGNWVSFENLFYKIHSIAEVFPTLDTEEFGIGVVDYNNIHPIHLTEEILLKCGFVRRGITSNNGSKLTLHHKDNMYLNGRVYWNSWCILDSIPEYLHQLQNLYFSLTGEELEINL